MQYPNVSQLQGWDSPIVKDYKITATPTYFVDREGKIVLKPKRICKVDAFGEELVIALKTKPLHEVGRSKEGQWPLSFCPSFSLLSSPSTPSFCHSS